MRIGIGFKLFVAVLVASIVMAVAMGIANRVSFQRGFLGYLNELESRRMSVLTTILAAHWREVGDPEHGWDALRGRDDLWRHIVRYSGYRLHSGPRHLPMLVPPEHQLRMCRSGPGLPYPYGTMDMGAPAGSDAPPLFPLLHQHPRPAGGFYPLPRPADDHGRRRTGASHAPHPDHARLAAQITPGQGRIRQLVPGEASADIGRAGLFWPPEARAAEMPGTGTAETPLLDALIDNEPMPGEGMPMPPGPDWTGHNRPPPPPRDAAARMTLQDAHGRFVVGNPNPGPDAHFVPILVDGVVAGWVGSERFTEVTDAADLAFQRRQESAAWYIAGLAVLLAAGIAWLLGRVMLVPARRLASATRALAAGQYDIRVPAESQDELGQLARVFNRLASTLQSNESMRRAFMADVSHELRTPLAIMRGELEAVEDGLQPLDQRVLQSLQSEVGILSKLVDDIHVLSITEMASMAYHWQMVDVVELLDSTLASWRERLAARGLGLKRVGVIDKIYVSGDPNRLRQVFQNLLENAVRYVDQGGQVQVGCQAGNPGVIIIFDDSGPGMPPEDFPRLFDRFYRREASRNRATGGSGLGLAICRGIVEAHGGHINAEASPLGGLRIRIELPPEHTSEGSG